MWSDERNRLLNGRVALLVYCHYNQRVLDRAYDSWAELDWGSFIEALQEEDPIKAPEGHAALNVPRLTFSCPLSSPSLSSTSSSSCEMTSTPAYEAT